MSQTELATEALTPEQLAAIVLELQEATRRIPVAAIQAARQHRNQVIPELIKLIQQATETLRRNEQLEYNGAFFAFFLLAEFQAAEGLPAIIEAISLPDDGPFELFGDVIHEVLPRVLVVLGQEQCLATCAALVRNKQLNQYVRWASARAIVYLAMAELRPRGEIVGVCQELLREAIALKDSDTITSLIDSMLPLHPWEASKEIKEAFQSGSVDTEIIEWEKAEMLLHDEPMRPSSEYPMPIPIADTIAELADWASFQTDEKRRTVSSRANHGVQSGKFTPLPPLSAAPLERIKPRPRVGRNDPCPCGSGKKFKKCCLSRL